MPSSYTTSLRLEMQAAGENLNTWGAPKLNNVIARVDAAIAGRTTLALGAATAYTLTSSNSTDDEARAAILDFTSGTANCVVTIPSVSKSYIVRNQTAYTRTLTVGAGATVTVDPSAIVQVFCDGSGVKELGFSGLGLKAYIDAAALATSGSLPATTGNEGKGLFVTSGLWTPRFATTEDIGVASAAELWAGLTDAKIVTPETLLAAAASQALTYASTITLSRIDGWNRHLTLGGNATLANPSDFVAGQSGRIRVTQGGAGNRTLAKGSAWKIAGGFSSFPLSSTPGAVDDIVYYVHDASNIECTVLAGLGA